MHSKPNLSEKKQKQKQKQNSGHWFPRLLERYLLDHEFFPLVILFSSVRWLHLASLKSQCGLRSTRTPLYVVPLNV